jgi:putative transposase
VIRTFKYRLRPNKQESQALDYLLWQARNLYNAALEQRINVYCETRKGISYPAQWAHFRDIRNAHPDTLGRLNATSVQQMLRRLDKSFGAFFRRVRAGETPGFPRFKGRHRFKSIEYRYGDGCKLRSRENGQRRFYIQTVGEVKVIYHRPIPENATIKHVVIKQVNEKWFVCLMLEIPETEQVPLHQGNSIGIDLGMLSLLATSERQLYDNPRWLRQSLSELRIAQRRVPSVTIIVRQLQPII